MKSLFLILFSITLLFSQATEHNTTFDKALKLYKEQAYEKAFNAFLILLEDDLSSVKLNFHLAQSASKIKKYNEAIAAYERILIYHPTHNRSKLELARIYYTLEQFERSTHYFNEVLQSEPPLQVKLNITTYLKKIKNRDNISHFSGQLQVGVNYDSNINGASNADTFYVPALNATFTNTSLNTHDWSHQEVVLLHHILDTSKIWGFKIKNDFTLYARNLETYSDYNILYLNHSPAASWKFNKLELDLGLSNDMMWYGGEYFLDNYALFAKLLYKSSQQTNYMAMIKDIKKVYQQDAFSSRNAKQQELTLSFQSRLNKYWSVFLREVIQIERKVSGNDTNVDYDSYDSSLGFSYIASSRWQLNMLLGYKKMTFLDKDPFFLEEHIENRYTLKVGANTLLTPTLSLESSVAGVKNNSTIETSNYERFVFAMNLNKKF